MRPFVFLCIPGASSFLIQPWRHGSQPFTPPQCRTAGSLDLLATVSDDTSTQSTETSIPLNKLMQLASEAKSYDPAVRAAVVAEKLYAQDNLASVLSIWSTVSHKLQEWHMRQDVFLEGDGNDRRKEADHPALKNVDLSEVHVYTARDAAVHAEALLGNATSVQAIRAAMECWRNSRDETAPQHVEALLEREDTPAGLQLLLDTYASSRNVPNRVETLEGLVAQAPTKTTRCYNSLLLVYSKMPTNKMEEALALLNELKETYAKTKNPAQQPDLLTYSHVMECLARAETTEALEITEGLLKEIQALSKEDDRFEPSVYTYATMIKAYTRLNQPQKAEAMLEYAPVNVMLMTGVLHAWSRSRHPEKPLRALELLKQMKTKLQPTTVSYNAVIESCNRSKHPASLKIAFAVFRSLEQDPNVAPDYWTFVNLLSAIGRALPSASEERNNIVGAVFQKAVDLQLVHRKVLGKLITVCDSTYLTTLLTPHMTPDASGRFDFEQIPLKWNKNAQS